MPTVKYLGPEPTRRVGGGMLIRGQAIEVTQERLDSIRSQCINCEIVGDANVPTETVVEETTVDEGNDGVPDNGWTRADIAAWLADEGVTTRAGLTKKQLLAKVEEQLNPTDDTEEATGSDE